VWEASCSCSYQRATWKVKVPLYGINFFVFFTLITMVCFQCLSLIINLKSEKFNADGTLLICLLFVVER